MSQRKKGPPPRDEPSYQLHKQIMASVNAYIDHVNACVPVAYRRDLVSLDVAVTFGHVATQIAKFDPKFRVRLAVWLLDKEIKP